VALASPGRYAEYRNAHPHADGPASTTASALEPVIPIPAPRDGRHRERLPAPPVTGDVLAAAHVGPTERAVDAVHAAAVSAVIAVQRSAEPVPPQPLAA
jgi:hypothetical protein